MGQDPLGFLWVASPVPGGDVERASARTPGWENKDFLPQHAGRALAENPRKQVKLSTLKIILICFFPLKEGVSKQKSMSLGSSPVGFKKLSTSHFRIPLHRHVQNIDQKSREEDYYWEILCHMFKPPLSCTFGRGPIDIAAEAIDTAFT